MSSWPEFDLFFSYIMSYNTFMLCHYGDTIVPNVNSNITLNGERNLLLNGNSGMSYAKMKEVIFHGLGWNYNDIDVKITWRCWIREHQYFLVLVMCYGSFKTMNDSLIQSGLNMIVLYVNSWPKNVFVPTSSSLSKLVSKWKNSLLSDNLMQTIDDTIFDNLFADQHQFNYSKPRDNKDDETLNPNITINVDDDVDNDGDCDVDNDVNDDDQMISHILNL